MTALLGHLTMRRARVSAIGCMALFLSGCAAWAKPVAPTPDFLRDLDALEALVLTRDSVTLHLQRPDIVGDSIVGRSAGKRHAVALADVATVRVLRYDGLRTFLFMLSPFVLGYGLYRVLLPST